jgi:hypothetical protein
MPREVTLLENTYVGPFLILNKLGNTQRHRVFHARQTQQNRDVAIKFLSVPTGVARSKALDKIEREADALQQLSHPNLVRVFGAGADDDRIFFATELVEGESLTSLLARRGRISTDLAIEFGTQIAELLTYLNQKDLVHSKLTPDKILIGPENQVKVTDLRLNRARRRRWDAIRKRELDIAAYMAPEQFTEGATAKSDLYSLGVILFEMLTGKLPYSLGTIERMTKHKLNKPVPSVSQIQIGCPVWLDKLVTELLQPNPRKRPHSARAVLLAFQEIRRVVAGREAAVTQASKSFNALNAGVDKTEARRLLGKSAKPATPSVPFFERVPVLVAGLLAIAGIATWIMLPASERSIVERARQMIGSNESIAWTEARELLTPVMKGNGPLAVQAETLFYQSRKKTLDRHAALEIDHGLLSKPDRRFVEAAILQKQGQPIEALQAFAQLIADYEEDGKERYIHAAAKERLEALAAELPLPTEPAALIAMIQQLDSAQSSADLIAGRAMLGAIMIRYSGEEGYAMVNQAAKQMLIVIDQKANGNLDLDAILNGQGDTSGT